MKALILMTSLFLASFAQAGIIGDNPDISEAARCVPAEGQLPLAYDIEEVIVQVVGLHGTLQTLVQYTDGNSDVVFTRYIKNSFVPGRVAATNERVSEFVIRDARQTGESVGALVLDGQLRVRLDCAAGN